MSLQFVNLYRGYFKKKKQDYCWCVMFKQNVQQKKKKITTFNVNMVHR